MKLWPFSQRTLLVVALVLAFILLGALFLFNRKNKEVPAGGPCSYESTYFPATILSMQPINDFPDANYDLEFEVDFDGYKDTVYYSYVMNRHVPAAEVKQQQYKVGQRLTCEKMTIVTGTCNPDILQLQLTPFDSIPKSLRKDEAAK